MTTQGAAPRSLANRRRRRARSRRVTDHRRNVSGRRCEPRWASLAKPHR